MVVIIISRQRIPFKILALLIFLTHGLLSQPSHAWSQKSYEIILATAEFRDKDLYNRVRATVNDTEIRLFDTYLDTSKDVRDAFVRHSRDVPSILNFDGFYFNKASFILRRGGFERRDLGPLSVNYKAVENALKIEKNDELKLRLMSLLTFLRVSAYFPSNIVSYRDSRAFFYTDRYGYYYCLGTPKRKISRCGDKNIHQYTANLMNLYNIKYLPELDSNHIFANIDDVIVSSANKARELYRIKPGVRLSEAYQQSSLLILERQASMAVSDILWLWRRYYPIETN